MVGTIARSAALAATALLCALAVPGPAEAAIPAKYANCTNLHRYYPHGLGRVGARDHVAAGAVPVTTWARSTAAFNLAMHYNRGLDRDHDYIACEKR